MSGLGQANKGGIHWFLGIVKDLDDPYELGRVRVQIISELDTDEAMDSYPWCKILMPPTNSAMDQKGASPVGLTIGAFCIGFYMDGMGKQYPLLMGTFHGMQDLDPLKSDVNILARGVNKITKNYTGPEPGSAYGAKYPLNQVFESRAGHIIEIDDTDGAERIHIYHAAGTYIEINKDGRIVIKSVDSSIDVTDKEKKIYAKGNITIETEKTLTLKAGEGIKMSAPGGVTVTQGSITARGSISSAVGVSGTFTSPTGQTIHVQKGLVTNITG